MQERERVTMSATETKQKVIKQVNLSIPFETDRHTNSKKWKKGEGRIKKKTSREYKETGQEEFSIHLPSKVNTKRCEDRKQYLYLRRGKINKYQK